MEVSGSLERLTVLSGVLGIVAQCRLLAKDRSTFVGGYLSPVVIGLLSELVSFANEEEHHITRAVTSSTTHVAVEEEKEVRARAARLFRADAMATLDSCVSRATHPLVRELFEAKYPRDESHESVMVRRDFVEALLVFQGVSAFVPSAVRRVEVGDDTSTHVLLDPFEEALYGGSVTCLELMDAFETCTSWDLKFKLLAMVRATTSVAESKSGGAPAMLQQLVHRVLPRDLSVTTPSGAELLRTVSIDERVVAHLSNALAICGAYVATQRAIAIEEEEANSDAKAAEAEALLSRIHLPRSLMRFFVEATDPEGVVEDVVRRVRR